MQMFVIGKEKEDWNKILQHYRKYGVGSAVSATQMDILSKWSSGHLTLPSEKQSKILYQLYERAVEEEVADLVM